MRRLSEPYISRDGECSVDGCSRGIDAKGLCRPHYNESRGTTSVGFSTTMDGRREIKRFAEEQGLTVTELILEALREHWGIEL